MDDYLRTRYNLGLSYRTIATAVPPPTDSPDAREDKERDHTGDKQYNDAVHSAPPLPGENLPTAHIMDYRLSNVSCENNNLFYFSGIPTPTLKKR